MAFAGSGSSAVSSGDGGLATQASFRGLQALAVGPDGSLFIKDKNKIRRIDTDGKIRKVLGSDDPNATQAPQVGASNERDLAGTTIDDQKTGIAVDSMGRLYVVQSSVSSLFRVDPDGKVRRIAGGVGSGDIENDGQPALGSSIGTTSQVGVDAAGRVYLLSGGRLRTIDDQGKLQTLAGFVGINSDSGLGDGGLARAASLKQAEGLAIGPGGRMFIAQNSAPSALRVIKPLAPSQGAGEHIIPSRDGSMLHIFDGNGRHLRTEDALTGVVLRTFSYDASGLLAAVTDPRRSDTCSGQTCRLTITRSGSPTNRIVLAGPEPGLSTTLDLDYNGWLSAITYPKNIALNQIIGRRATHSSSGLLTVFEDFDGNEHLFDYEPSTGFLTEDRQPAPDSDPAFYGSKTLSRDDVNGGWEVSIQTGQGRTSKYKTTHDNQGSRTRTTVGWDQLPVISVDKTNGISETTYPDGMVVKMTRGPDKRFGTAAPIPSVLEVITPSGGPTMRMETEQEIVSNNIDNPLVPLGWKTSTWVNIHKDDRTIDNGWLSEVTSSGSTSTVTVRTPKSSLPGGQRRSVTLAAESGRLQQITLPEVAPITFAYHPSGRLHTISQKDRVLIFTHKNNGFLETIEAPATHLLTLASDDAGRTTGASFGSLASSSLQFGVDENSNLTSLTLLGQPGAPSHGFTYDTLDRGKKYTAPSVGGQAFVTEAFYTMDGQLDHVTLPGGVTAQMIYEPTSGKFTQLYPVQPNTNLPTIATTYYPNTDSAKGKLKTLNVQGGEGLEFLYQGAFLQRVNSTGVLARAVEWEYDNQFRAFREKVRHGASLNAASQVEYGFDNDGSLLSVSFPGPSNNTMAMSIVRSALSGRKTGTSVGSGTSLQESFGYDPDYGEWTSYSATRGSTSIYQVTYGQRDALGRLTYREQNSGHASIQKQKFEYDQAGQLTDIYDACQASGGNPCATWSKHTRYVYDKNGNRTFRRDVSPSGVETTEVSYTYDAQDRLTQRVLGSSTLKFEYTAEGRLKRTYAGFIPITQASYTYNLAGDLTQCSIAGATISYVYDALGRRVQRSGTGIPTSQWVYLDALRPAAEFRNGVLWSRFVYGTRGNVPELMLRYDATGTTVVSVHRFVVDERGSVRAVVDLADGSAVRREYNAWGEVVGADGQPLTTADPMTDHPFGFAGGLYDPVTKVVRFGARDYDPSLGRWLAKDPLGLAVGTNLYRYSKNDPINYIDVDGESPVAIGIGIAVLVAFGLNVPSDTSAAPADLPGLAGGLATGALGVEVGAATGAALAAGEFSAGAGALWRPLVAGALSLAKDTRGGCSAPSRGMRLADSPLKAGNLYDIAEAIETEFFKPGQTPKNADQAKALIKRAIDLLNIRRLRSVPPGKTNFPPKYSSNPDGSFSSGQVQNTSTMVGPDGAITIVKDGAIVLQLLP